LASLPEDKVSAGKSLHHQHQKNLRKYSGFSALNIYDPDNKEGVGYTLLIWKHRIDKQLGPSFQMSVVLAAGISLHKKDDNGVGKVLSIPFGTDHVIGYTFLTKRQKTQSRSGELKYCDRKYDPGRLHYGD